MLSVEDLAYHCAENFADCGISVSPTPCDWFFLEEHYGRDDCIDNRFVRAYAARVEKIGKAVEQCSTVCDFGKAT